MGGCNVHLGGQRGDDAGGAQLLVKLKGGIAGVVAAAGQVLRTHVHVRGVVVGHVGAHPAPGDGLTFPHGASRVERGKDLPQEVVDGGTRDATAHDQNALRGSQRGHS